MSHYLVTGGAGFIGSHTVAELLEQGHSVRVLDNFSTGKRENLAPFAENSALEVIEGDIRSLSVCEAAVRGMDYVLHLGALGSIPRSVADPVTSNEVNVGGTLNMLQAARDSGIRRFVFSSSSSAYGDNREIPKVEHHLGRPLSPYAISKLAGELYVRDFYGLFGLPTVAIRYFNVFGPGQDPDSAYAAVIPRFFSAYSKNSQPTIFGDGEQTRDFTFISNVVSANLLACTADEACLGMMFNIAGGERTSVNRLCAMIRELTGSDLEPVYEEARKGDVKHSLASIELAHEYVGYTPAVNVEEGLKKTAEWYNERM